jgi:alkylated DNA repair dioxygenase AlkB
VQFGLFGAGPPVFDVRLARVRRFELEHGAWLEHHSGWLDGHARVFEELRANAAWVQHRRMMYEREVDVPRLIAPAPIDAETGATKNENLARLLRSLAETLSSRYGRPFESISLAYYRDGRDSVAFHGDKVGRLVDDSVVATVSVGAPRHFLIKPNPKIQRGGESLSFELGWGDLFVMGGACQRTWQHAIPKCAKAEPRISIMFRQRTHADERP